MSEEPQAPHVTGTLQHVSRATYVREWLLAALFFLCAFVFVLAVGLIFIAVIAFIVRRSQH